jgi:hypothetical protein
VIGDPLYEAIKGRREAEERKRGAANRAIEARPEGVTIYQCNGVVAVGDTQDVDTPAIWRQGCGATFEQKPYVPRPWCHGSPARIVGYDWDRDVT